MSTLADSESLLLRSEDDESGDLSEDAVTVTKRSGLPPIWIAAVCISILLLLLGVAAYQNVELVTAEIQAGELAEDELVGVCTQIDT